MLTSDPGHSRSTTDVRPVQVERLPSLLGSARALAWALLLIDLGTLTFIYHLAYWLRSGEFTASLLSSQRWMVVTVVLMGFLYLFDTYRIDRIEARWRPAMRVVWAVTCTGLAIGVLVYLFGPELLGGRAYNVIGRTVMIPALGVFALVAITTRGLARRSIDRLSERIRWLVVGRADGGALAQFRNAFDRQRSPGELVMITDRPGVPGASGTWEDLETLLKERWSGLVVTGGELPPALVEHLMRARLAGLRIYDLGEFSEQLWQKLPVHHLSSGWLALSAGFTLLHEPANVHLKRVGDVVIAGLMLMLACPMMVVIWLLVRLTSRGPGFFLQERVGLNGKTFRCAKFRTMRVDAEQHGVQWATAKDPRVTIIGLFLRRSRMDELPQLWNILRGEMSLIGPRPERPEFTEMLAQQLPYYHLRHLVRPGLTGWAQVNYSYGASVEDAREKLEYDLYYLKNHSLALDLVILLRTVRVVLFGKGAR